MKNKLRPVEEVVSEITDYDENVGSICYPSDVEVRLAQDRHAIHTLLREIVTGVKADSRLGSSNPDRCDEYISRKTVLTLIDGIFVTNLDHENN